ncbi:hypothetical protein ASPBRDRAFT_409407 [Aspergillus brasiliensis CBS 101740]|uniref:Uncharacterized protein n=1 Tax=Aspergillus brasiliensis (strain CBS 101740 / IMI 381727 / IBT 21946) TaxID=767769 RepID=A0A1L9UXP1_ASPBC|nr:hypothetical protein ASPBRDRAFT_409407 [Aspergillus brasiliensis CBS 101740]
MKYRNETEKRSESSRGSQAQRGKRKSSWRPVGTPKKNKRWGFWLLTVSGQLAQLDLLLCTMYVSESFSTGDMGTNHGTIDQRREYFLFFFLPWWVLCVHSTWEGKSKKVSMYNGDFSGAGVCATWVLRCYNLLSFTFFFFFFFYYYEQRGHMTNSYSRY